MPSLKHPDSEQVIERRSEDVAIYASQGWELAKSDAKSASSKSSTTK